MIKFNAIKRWALENELKNLNLRIARYYALDHMRRDYEQNGEGLLDKLIGAKKKTLAEYNLLHSMMPKIFAKKTEIMLALERANFDEKTIKRRNRKKW